MAKRQLLSTDDILHRVRESPRVLIGLDFDGTLTPIQNRPDDCRLTSTQRTLLSSMAQFPRLRLGIISGRAISDIRTRVGVPEIAYAGNHGLEIEYHDTRFAEPHAESLRSSLRILVRDITQRLQSIPGCWLELKGPTATIHFREVESALVPDVNHIARTVIAAWPDFLLREGKRVLEIRPRIDWNKSHAVQWIRQQTFPEVEDSLLLYMGDDATDEDVFRSWPGEIMLGVGDLASPYTHSHLDDPDAVWELLHQIEATVRKPRTSIEFR